MNVDQLATQGVGAPVAIDIIYPKYISFSPWFTDVYTGADQLAVK